MSGAMTALIVSACVGLSGVKQEACEKGLEAGAKQTGIEKGVDAIQKESERKAKYIALDLIGKSGMDMVGGGIFLVKTVADKSVKFNLPTLGLCDRITNRVGVDKYSLEMVWGF